MVKSALNLKLIRDIWRNRMQFVAMILLCALGTWCFSGLDAFWRMLQTSADQYYAQQQMADFWVCLSPVDREAVARLKSIPGVQEVQARVSLEMTVDLPHEPLLQVHAFDGLPRMNIPLIREGRGLGAAELRGCLLEEQFAVANHIRVGDRITLKLGGEKTDFTVVGTCISPEHVITTQDVLPAPDKYGFMVCASAALSHLPYNEAVLTLRPGAEADAVQKTINALYPEALTMSRAGHFSSQSVTNEIDMFRNLSYLFPLLAFSVAALIVLTTLTRMIENHRLQIGTLKALGYHDGAVRRHYLCYALYPSLFGALLGLFTGRATLPYILWDSEASSYVFPRRLQAPISLEQWFVCGLAVALSVLICLRTYNKNARETSAALLRPKPPKAGRALALERIPALWNRLGFNGKMVVRNLFRNKLRTLMTFVGTLCCTMLLISSMGLQDSVRFFVNRYYYNALQYTLRANLTSDAGLPEAYTGRVEAERVEAVMERSVTVFAASRSRTTSLTVTQDGQRLLHLGKDETYLALPTRGVAFSRKLAQELGASPGDRVLISLPGDDQPVSTTLAALCDVNIGQGIYVTQSVWESFRKGPFLPTALLVKNPTQNGLQTLNAMDEVDQLRYPARQSVEMEALLQSMMGMFMLMSLVALGLAFVVQYNMGILNFMERNREYATLKVLGYHQKEIRGLIWSESNVVTGLGILCGALPGRWFTALILKTAEGPNVVFASTVNLSSYVISCLVAAVFSILVTWMLAHKVKTIDMVEALKSVE